MEVDEEMRTGIVSKINEVARKEIGFERMVPVKFARGLEIRVPLKFASGQDKDEIK